MTPSTTQTQDHYPIPTDDDATKVDDDLARQQTQLVSSVRLGPGVKANPGPLGLFSFATTAFVLGLYECGVGYVSHSTSHSHANKISVFPTPTPSAQSAPFQAIFGLAVFVGGFAQFVAGCFEYACVPPYPPLTFAYHTKNTLDQQTHSASPSTASSEASGSPSACSWSPPSGTYSLQPVSDYPETSQANARFLD